MFSDNKESTLLIMLIYGACKIFATLNKIFTLPKYKKVHFMKKITLAMAILMSFGLVACSNTDIYSGNVYEGYEAKSAKAISYGVILSSRPVKIQAGADQNALGGIAGGVIGGILGSNIGGGSGQMLASAVGAVAGAVVGSKAEEKFNQVDSLELVIKKDNGQEIVAVQKYDPSLVAGARVRIVGTSRVNVSVVR